MYSFASTSQTAPPVSSGGTSSPLNAGTITVTTPSTSATLTYQNGAYFASDAKGALIPPNGGQITFTNGNGGPDIGTFSGAQITLGPPLNWTTPPATVNRP